MRFIRVGEVMRLAKELERECDPWTGALAAMIRACAENATGNRTAAIASLRSAVERTEATDTIVYASPARYRLGQLIGGDEGALLVKTATETMAASGIRAPARWVAFYFPGTWGGVPSGT
jgi:hypothetical protein